MKTVCIYVNTDALPGDVDHLKVFASDEAAQRWFDETIRKGSPSNSRCMNNRGIAPGAGDAFSSDQEQWSYRNERQKKLFAQSRRDSLPEST
jgi:hypothetical protein